MNFKQAMIVPTMVSLGCGTLLMAQNLSLVEVSYAAPATGGAAVTGTAPAAGNKAANPSGTATPGPGALPLPASADSPEFGASAGKVVKAISDSELASKALESSGREDPFMALVPPDPNQIVPPPVTFAPIKPVPPVSLGTPKPIKPVKPPKPPKIEDLPWAGDKPPAVSEPQWLVRGILSTHGERITMLEGKDSNVQARVGDVLEDGSKVVAISSRGVTFLRGNRRFVKQIGGSN
jgi:hypothetical protein